MDDIEKVSAVQEASPAPATPAPGSAATLKVLLITSVIANVVLVGATAAALQRANCKDKDESGLAWDAEVMQLYKSGQFEACPAETTWWTHHANVYGGYEGCVGENGYLPCAQDGFGGLSATDKFYLYNTSTGECTETGKTMTTRAFWVLWGHPQDKYELTKRTGLNPVVTFPFNRGPYPSMAESGGDHGDDAIDARATAKDLLVYLGSFSKAELETWSVSFTEGAEQGHIQNIAAAALIMARTTCNRDISILVEAPAYGYDLDTAAALATAAGGFLDCSALYPALQEEITLNYVGWMPGSAFPTATGADGLVYAADSADPNSPWLETMVFPENPSGTIKVPQNPDPSRRVCDGVYNWPMYYGMEGWKIPLDKRPDCLTWAFSVTKAYSATVRAGFSISNDALDTGGALREISGSQMGMKDGLYSEWSWSWFGQMQIQQMIMSKPLDDTTSWVGAYTEIMKEKWDALIPAFKDCPYIELTNDYAGAYAWFKKMGVALGLETSWLSAFFSDTMGVTVPLYSWGFRGADPADYYGAEYTTSDFVRMQLYRDLSVYVEIAARATTVCGGGAVEGYMSGEEYVAAATATRRRLTEGAGLSFDDHYDIIHAATNGRLKHEHIAHHASMKVLHEETHKKIEAFCAPAYTTDCLFKHSSAVAGDIDF